MTKESEAIVRALSTIPLFHGLDARQIRKIAARFSELDYKEGDVIVAQGKIGIGLFIIESGRVEVLKERVDGTKIMLEMLGANQFFGELSLLDEEPRTASVIAVEETKCLAITRLDFLDVLREDVDIPILMMKELARRLRLALEVR
ncbi:MAG: cyclic nucleotide-binding domain-containing protein [Chloroflexi bacterium]|nr:cyclic nucleotide-binding domain-containing protein [Chloroflexota bacterium]